MRIAIVYDSLFPLNTGGGERVYRRMADLLVDAGHEVDYLTRLQWESTAPETSFRLVTVWNGEIYDGAGKRTISSALAFGRGVFTSLRHSRGNYDVVIASALPVLTLLAARAALVGTRTWLVGDWLEVWTWGKWRSYSGAVAGTIAFVLQGLGLRASDADTVNSEFTAARVRRGRKRSTPLVLGLVDLVESSYSPVAAADPPYLLIVGRLIPDKRVTAIPAALARARETLPELRAKIVGTGPELDAIIHAIADARMESSIDTTGRVDDTELGNLFARAAVHVSASAREGFGLVVAEAAAHGVPSVVVAGDDNAAVDLVQPGTNGAVSASASPDDLAKAIVDVVEAGSDLRRSTFSWFEAERATNSLARSISTLLERYPRAR